MRVNRISRLGAGTMLPAAVALVPAVALVLIGGTRAAWGAGQAPQPAGTKSVVQQNLFHPSRAVPSRPKPARKVEPPAPSPVVAPPPPPPPKFSLSGVILDGDTAMALVKEPQLTSNGIRLVTLGEEVGTYRLVEILGDRVVMEGAAGRLTVLLADPSKSRGVQVASTPTQVAVPAPVEEQPPAASLPSGAAPAQPVIDLEKAAQGVAPQKPQAGFARPLSGQAVQPTAGPQGGGGSQGAQTGISED